MEEKKIVQFVVTKYYLLAWVFGLIGLFFIYLDVDAIAVLFLSLCVTYSIADSVYPPPPIKSDEPPKNNDNGGPTAA